MLKFELLSGRIECCTRDSAAFDLFYEGDEGESPIVIVDKPVGIPTGVRTAFSPELVAIIKEKSGLALKGIELKAGVIDADYRDEWIVVARNPVQIEVTTRRYWLLRLLGFKDRIDLVPVKDWKPFVLKPGMKIAQFLLIEKPKVSFVGANIVIKNDERQGGFGSTGLESKP